MAEGRARLEWGQTAAQMAQFHNANHKRRRQPGDFDPFVLRERREARVSVGEVVQWMRTGREPQRD